MTVRYRNYKQFGATIRVRESTEVPTPLPDSQQVPGQ
jgi:hypothetical protein